MRSTCVAYNTPIRGRPSPSEPNVQMNCVPFMSPRPSFAFRTIGFRSCASSTYVSVEEEESGLVGEDVCVVHVN